MNDYLNDEQRQLVHALTRYLEREHRLPDSGVQLPGARHLDTPSAHWAAFSNFGLLALSVDEAQGGIQDDPVCVHAAMEQFGRHLVREPYLGTIVQGARILAHSARAQPEASTLLNLVLEGNCQLALAHAERQTDYNLHNIEARAVRNASGWVLDGHKVFVHYAAQAHSWLVLARTRGAPLDQDGLSLFIVDPQAHGVRCRNYFNLDGSSCAEIWFDSVQLSPSSIIGMEHGAWQIFERACTYANAALCAEAVGAMSAVLDATTAYAKERKQFGTAIGSFQAIQHRLVDMYIQCEKSRSLSQRASSMANTDGFLTAVSAAKAMCCQSARFISQSAIQIHGGIGMTDELALGKFVKRLMTITHTLGDQQHHIQQFVRMTQPLSAVRLATTY
ncbi:pimeloyl-CoA dehydrogenase small subunit [Pusillimonas sp. TS35]|nr:pimeloyl-CoA dehydrogenase small subunit [Pusillimonas sp. TS35]